MKKRFHYFSFILICLYPFLAFGAIDYSILFSVLARLPNWDESQIQVHEISGGATNHNVRVNVGNQSYFVRMGSDVPSALDLNSEREYLCSKLAAEQGIAPEVILYDAENRIMVTPFIVALPFDIKQKELLKKTLIAIKHLHTSSAVFPTQFCPYKNIEFYYQKATELNSLYKMTMTSQLWQAFKEIQRVLPVFSTLCPCHLDLNDQNFLNDGKKVWIIDWEYAAMADPFYDLATLASTSQFSSMQMKEMLDLYLDSTASQEEFAQLYLKSILVDLRWGLWCLIQMEISTLDFDYPRWAKTFFEQATARIKHTDYQKSLEVLQNKT